MYKAEISGTQVGENTMNRKLSRVCTTYYDVICVKQKSAPNIQYKDKEVRFLRAKLKWIGRTKTRITHYFKRHGIDETRKG